MAVASRPKADESFSAREAAPTAVLKKPAPDASAWSPIATLLELEPMANAPCPTATFQLFSSLLASAPVPMAVLKVGRALVPPLAFAL